MTFENQKMTAELDEQAISSEDFSDDEIDESYSDIRSSSTIHDRLQFETKFDFELTSNNNINKKKQYNVDVYFFIPQNTGINTDTYTRENFYTDLTNYFRIRTPELFKLDANNFYDWSLPWSDKYFTNHLSTHKRQKLISVVVYEIKMFGCFINTQLKRIQSIFSNIVKKKGDSFFKNQKYLKILENRLNKLQLIINKYRNNYVKPIKEQKILTDDEVTKVFSVVDEFISYRFEYIFIKIKTLLESKSSDCYLNDLIKQMLLDEISYRKDTDFVDLDNTNDKNLYETYHYRVGLLKKYVLDVLYLQNENIKQEKIYRNIIAAVGAALAAFWASVADMQRLNMMNNMKDTGFRLIIIIMIGVLAYVFKDRLKELSREYFSQKFKKYIPDFNRKMFYNYFDFEGQPRKEFLGSSKEFMRYMNKDSVPKEIMYIRHIGSRSDLDPDKKEIIINYSKKINFRSSPVKDSITKINFIRDLSRFDISEFLAKLSDPDKVLRYFDSQKGIVSIDAPKVYHINLIIKYTTTYDNKSVIELERSRIILNKRGILRIEKVVGREQIRYEEEK